MREAFSLRGAHVRALLVVIAPLIVGDCTEKLAFAEAHTTTSTVESPPTHHFGDKGDVILPVLGGGIDLSNGLTYSVAGMSISHQSTEDVYGRNNFTAFSFQPSADFFVSRHVSIGGQIGFSYNRFTTHPTSYGISQSYGSTDMGGFTLGLAPRVGYLFPMSEHFALWPRVAIGAAAQYTIGPDAQVPLTPVTISGALDFGLVYAVDRRFYVAFTPSFAVAGFPQVGSGYSSFSTSFDTSFTAGFVL
jgi:hypothetical protein